ncbi:MAG TPA: hypothetical protein VLT33_16640 [Labilithrix sp.]|nr:hypothetical protein [Labilithrix sp.]
MSSRSLALALLLGTSSLALGCGDAATEAPVGQGEYRWGLLDEDSLVPDAPQYLVNKARGATYRVCLPRYMAEALPGIEPEVFASINVWAAYLGRTVNVEIVTKDLPRSRADQSVDDLAALYHATCGADFDVVMGFAKTEGAAVGLTGSSFEFIPQADGTRKITAFSRFLFLRDYDIVSTVGEDGVRERWTSLAAEDAATTSGPALLAKMLTRSSTRYASGSTYLVLPVLTHEYGHVWGLCDQYESSTNCDPTSSSSHRVEASIMGARSATQRLYLTDDDVQGIRVLGGKTGFAHDWGPPRRDAPAPIALRPVELARIDGVRREGHALVVSYGVVTGGPARYAFALQAAGSTEFTPLTSDFASATPFDVPVGRLTITLAAPDARPFLVRLVVTPASGAPVTVLAPER